MSSIHADSEFTLDDLVIEDLGQNLGGAAPDGCFSCGYGLRIVTRASDDRITT